MLISLCILGFLVYFQDFQQCLKKIDLSQILPTDQQLFFKSPLIIQKAICKHFTNQKNQHIRMLKHNNTITHHQSLLSKKQKKRSSSASQNKQNISTSHNNSSLLEGHRQGPKRNLNTKKSQLLPSKQTKNIKQTTRIRSVTKLGFISNENQVSKAHLPQDKVLKGMEGSFVHKKNKKLPLDKQHKKCDKQPKRKFPSQMVIIQDDGDSNFYFELKNLKNLKKSKIIQKSGLLMNQPQISKSSTLISKSTGNIQFSEFSYQDQCQRKGNFQQIITKKQIKDQRYENTERQKQVFQQRSKLAIRKYKLSNDNAAILIQKTWRGYLTRRLLEQFIESFEPIYEEQLNQMRSGRQSRQQYRQRGSTHKKHQQKSSFFDRSQLEQCSEIEPLQVQNTSLSFQDNSKIIEQYQQPNASSRLTQQNQSFKTKNRGNSYRQRQNENQDIDLPVQVMYFKKPFRSEKRQKQPQIQQSDRSRMKNIKQTPQTCSRITQFTIKNNQTCSKNQLITGAHGCNEETKKIFSSKTLNLSICSQTAFYANKVQQSIELNVSPFEKLHQISSQLEGLFFCLNNLCVDELKSSIKSNKLSLKQLMERKQALKDIVANGKDFIQNVEDEISKAFRQMNRVTKEGCEQTEEKCNNDQEISHNQKSQHKFQDKSQRNPNKMHEIQRQSSDSSLETKDRYLSNKELSSQKDYQSNLKRTVNKFYAENLSSSREGDGDNLSSDKKYYSSQSSHSGKKYSRSQNPASQFYRIELPTEEYSIKGKSPIQEQLEQGSYNQGSEDVEVQEMDDDYNQKQDCSSELQAQNDQREQFQGQQQPSPNTEYESHRQSFQILNQFLLNLIQEYEQINQTEDRMSQLQYLCETLKRVSCDSQNKTIIDRCLIEFIVEMMSETFTLAEIYQEFKRIIYRHEEDASPEQMHQDQAKLRTIIRRWIDQLQKWQMNIIQEVPSKMQSSSFINTGNISLNQLREAISNMQNKF